MATYNVNTGINAYVTLSGSVQADAAFATQPVVGDQIVFPVNLTVDAQLNISGPSGTHKLWHVKQNGETVATSYVITPGSIAIGTFTYEMPATYTVATLQTGFDSYVFEGWSPQPVVGEQLITETQYGYFDNLGNYYSNVENIHDAWHVGLDGTTTNFEIDNRLNVTSSDITPSQFNFVDITGQALSTVVESAPIDVLGMDAGLDSPLTVTNGEWAKSSDNGQTYSAYTTAPGTIRNGDKVKVRHTTSAVGLTQVDTTLDINGVSDVFSSTTAADITPNAFVLGSISGVALSTVIESSPVTISGMTASQDSPISINYGEYAISTDGGSSYGAWTSSAGNIQNGNLVKVRHTSSSTDLDTRVSTLDINGVISNFVTTTIDSGLAPSLTINDPYVVLSKFFGDISHITVEDNSSNWASFILYNEGAAITLASMTDVQFLMTNTSTGNVYQAGLVANPSIVKFDSDIGEVSCRLGQIGAPVGYYDLDVVYYDANHANGAYMTQDRQISVRIK